MKLGTDKNGKTWQYIKGSWILEKPNPRNYALKPDVYLLGELKITETRNSIVEMVCKCGCGRTFHSTSKIYYNDTCQKRKYRKVKGAVANQPHI